MVLGGFVSALSEKKQAVLLFFSFSRLIFMVHTQKLTVLEILVMFLFANHRSFYWNKSSSKPWWLILALVLCNAGVKDGIWTLYSCPPPWLAKPCCTCPQVSGDVIRHMDIWIKAKTQTKGC